MALQTVKGFDLNLDALGALERGRQSVQAGELRGLQLGGQRAQTRSNIDQAAAQAAISGAVQLKGIGDPQQKVSFLTQKLEEFRQAGFPTQAIDDALSLAEQGRFDELAQRTDQLISLGQKQQGLTPTQREFESFTQGLSLEDEERARRIKLGLDARPTGAAPQIVDVGGVPHIFDKQQGKLIPANIQGKDVTATTVAESRAAIAQAKKFAELTGSSRAKAIDKGFERITSIDNSVRNIDRAIDALNAGAGTGAIEGRFFPSIKAASVTLDQIQGEMALDVVGATTFGALSKGELDLARDIALPKNLNKSELLDFLQRKRVAQDKLRAYYSEQIQFLDQGGTVAEFLRSKERGSLQAPQQEQQAVEQSQAEPQSFTSSSGITFTVE